MLMTVAGFSCINNEKITPKNLTSLEEVLRDVPKLIDRLHAGGDYNSDEYSAKAVRNTTADRAPAADVECEELTLTKDEWKRIHTGFQVIVNLRRGTPEVCVTTLSLCGYVAHRPLCTGRLQSMWAAYDRCVRYNERSTSCLLNKIQPKPEQPDENPLSASE